MNHGPKAAPQNYVAYPEFGEKDLDALPHASPLTPHLFLWSQPRVG